MAPDAYEILDVPRNTGANEIRKAYRKLALDFHPDRNPGDPEAEARFKEIVIAYETLRDPAKRAAHDSLPRGSGTRSPRTDKDSGPFDQEWEDIFSQIFRGRRGAKKPARERGSDLQSRVEITLEEAAAGVSREVSVDRLTVCGQCRGEGTDPEAAAVACRLCGETGEIRFHRGLAEAAIPCATCMGSGTHSRKKCPGCRGAGRLRQRERIRVKVAATVVDGTQLRVRGKGNEGGGETGDLLVGVRIKAHKIFERSGNDIFFNQPITIVQAALGDEITVPTLGGRVKVRIPAGTQTGQIFRLRGKGLSPPGGRRTGDQLVSVTVETPIRLNKKLRALFREFQRLSSASTNPLTKRFLDKVKSFLR